MFKNHIVNDFSYVFVNRIVQNRQAVRKKKHYHKTGQRIPVVLFSVLPIMICLIICLNTKNI